jgi:hypothetical protein
MILATILLAMKLFNCLAEEKAEAKKTLTKKVATKKVATKKVATKKVATKKAATKKSGRPAKAVPKFAQAVVAEAPQKNAFGEKFVEGTAFDFDYGKLLIIALCVNIAVQVS